MDAPESLVILAAGIVILVALVWGVRQLRALMRKAMVAIKTLEDFDRQNGMTHTEVVRRINMLETQVKALFDRFPTREDLYKQNDVLLDHIARLTARVELSQSVGSLLMDSQASELTERFVAVNNKIRDLSPKEVEMADGAEKYSLQQTLARLRGEQAKLADQIGQLIQVVKKA